MKKKNSLTIEFSDFKDIDFTTTDEEPTNTTEGIELEVEELPDLFLKILEEKEDE